MIIRTLTSWLTTSGPALTAALCLFLWTAGAMAEPQVQVRLSADEVEVDDAVTVSMNTTYEGNVRPANPQLQAPKGFAVAGPSVFERSFNFRFNGRRVVKQSLSADWTMVPNRVGTFTIPSPTMVVDGKVVKGAPLKLKVVKKGTLPNKRPRRRSFGGFGSFFIPRDRGFDIDSLLDDDDQPLTREGSQLSMRRAPDPQVFVRIIPSKTKAYVGEQITLSYYLYRRPRERGVRLRNPPLPDFKRYDLPNPQREREVLTQVGAQRFYARLVEQEAAFPMRAGKLKTGTAEGTLLVPRLGRRAIVRESNDVVIDVMEPPEDGRPAGYRMGDVGRQFRLAAEVAPRNITAGGTVSVQVRLEGLGQLPTKLKLPERAGVEWYEPEVKSKVQKSRGQIGGWKTFGYAVRIDEPGKVDLGDITLPFFDPKEERYVTAKVTLGEVVVRPSKTPPPDGSQSPPPADEEASPFAQLAGPRPTLSAYTPTQDGGFSPTLLYALVLTPPLGVALAGGLLRGVTGLRRRRETQAEAPDALARQALSEAEKTSDPKRAAALCEKAIHHAIEARTGIKSRGVLLDELAPKLRKKGVKRAVAKDVLAVLQRCADLRFAPADDDDEALAARTKKIVKALLP